MIYTKYLIQTSDIAPLNITKESTSHFYTNLRHYWCLNNPLNTCMVSTIYYMLISVYKIRNIYALHLKIQQTLLLWWKVTTSLKLQHRMRFAKHLNYVLFKLSWWRGKPSGRIACTRKPQPWFYWNCSSLVINESDLLILLI